jgi:membrane protein DedA with SNARE-associated domain
VTSFLEHFLADYGLWAVFGLMLIDAVLPAASELVMLYGGALASGALAHELDVFGTRSSGFDAYIAIALAGTIGYLIGALAGWAIGFYGGRPFLERRGRWFHLTHARLERAERWFDRFGDWAVFVGRLTPVARSFVSIPAGVFEARLPRYTVLTAIGSAIWCFAFAGAGWALGASWTRLHHDFRYVEIAFVAGVVLLVTYWFLRRRRSTTMSRRASDTPR